jgi:hypothetical protein
MAYRDGSWSKRDEAHLAQVAESLGIAPTQAWKLRVQVEGERAPEG